VGVLFTYGGMILYTLPLCYYGWMWPVPQPPKGSSYGALEVLLVSLPINVHIMAACLGILLFSGALRNAVRSESYLRAAREIKRQQLRASVSRNYKPSPNAQWQNKVKELAGRGFTLKALLSFYRQLGGETMPHYRPDIHTTNDVVRQAIIPLSSDSQKAFASLMMKDVPTYPTKIVTHNWNNLFRDLVAAIVADALGEIEYCRVAYALDNELNILETWLGRLQMLDNTYWVCAFSICQHSSICGCITSQDIDKVTGERHPVCTCAKEKFLNETPPVNEEGRSIECEMNKFDDMMVYLAAHCNSFCQVIAIDVRCKVFGRAWCMAEVAAAKLAGMKQHLKIHSESCLILNEKALHSLRIQNMRASRPEDVREILAKIHNHEEFNRELHKLIFDELLEHLWSLDAIQQLERIGRLCRWEFIRMSRGSQTIWQTTISSGHVPS